MGGVAPLMSHLMFYYRPLYKRATAGAWNPLFKSNSLRVCSGVYSVWCDLLFAHAWKKNCSPPSSLQDSGRYSTYIICGGPRSGGFLHALPRRRSLRGQSVRFRGRRD